MKKEKREKRNTRKKIKRKTGRDLEIEKVRE